MSAEEPPISPQTPVSGNDQFEPWVRDFARLIRSAIARVGGTKTQSEADEIEQKVLIALWKQISSEQTIQHPSSYIYRAAVRETIRALKSLNSRREDSLEMIQHRSSDAREPQSTLENKEKILLVRKAIGELNDSRKLAVQAHLGGFTVQEIMRMHNWSYQKARNLIARGMADLRRLLKKEGVYD